MFWNLIVSEDYNTDHNNKDLINGNTKLRKIFKKLQKRKNKL